MRRFVLAPDAALDLVEIWQFIKRESSRTTADRVERIIRGKCVLLSGTPGAGHSRQDLTSAPVRFFPVYEYLIVYRPETKPLHVVAILHGNRNLKRVLRDRL